MSNSTSDRRRVRIFVSWSHRDARRKGALLGLVKDRVGLARDLLTDWWEDSDLVIGRGWHAGIGAEIEACDYGLQLVSPAFLNSGYIRDYEIPPFVGLAARKGALPVGLVPVPFTPTTQMYGIEDLQVFRGHAGRFFSQCRDQDSKEAFADALAAKILDRFRRDGADG